MSSKKIIALLLLFYLAVLNLPAQNTSCICPAVKMTEPVFSGRAGETVAFAVEVKGWKGAIAYHWTVTSGTIVEGQGTPAIKVKTDEFESVNLTATVEIRGDWCPTCENTAASDSVYLKAPDKAILLDRFERANCEVVLERMDYFMNQLQNNPVAAGYLVIYGKPGAVRATENEVRNWFKFRRFDPVRVTIDRGAGGERAEIEFWLVPPGADLPEISAPFENANSKENPEPAVKPIKPYLYTFQTADGIDGCKPPFDLEGYVEALKLNPQSRGNIVIYEANVKAFRQKEKEILGELLKDSIVRTRLRTFFVKVKPNILAEGVELWFLP